MSVHPTSIVNGSAHFGRDFRFVSDAATARVPLTGADRLYGAVARGAFPLVWMAARLSGASAEELCCRTGTMPRAGTPLLWFHGASAGEMVAATRLAEVLRQHGHRFTAACTATNRPGVEYVERNLGPDTVAALAPWDHPRWVAHALDQWRPLALFLVETELWPRLILEAFWRNVPVFCVSARIYPRDVPRYRLMRDLLRPMLRRLTGILAQNEIERERFVALGAPPDRCFVNGNLKYIAADPGGCDGSLRTELGLRREDRVVVCGSLHADEIRPLFTALEHLSMDTVRVIIAPRHRAAIGPIVRESEQRAWTFAVRTAHPARRDWRVLVLDRMGELSRAYAIASIGVVGGGFGKHGGHNPFEPVMVGTPVVFGKHFAHFEAEARALATAVPEALARDASQLGQRLAVWLTSEPERQRVLELQQQTLPDGAGIARGYAATLSPWLTGCRA